MKQGIPYRIGEDGPLLMDVPIADINGLSTSSKTVRLTGDLLNVYFATGAREEEGL